jgi:hypothetical protein
MASFAEVNRLMGLEQIGALEAQFIPQDLPKDRG